MNSKTIFLSFFVFVALSACISYFSEETLYLLKQKCLDLVDNAHLDSYSEIPSCKTQKSCFNAAKQHFFDYSLNEHPTTIKNDLQLLNAYVANSWFYFNRAKEELKTITKKCERLNFSETYKNINDAKLYLRKAFNYLDEINALIPKVLYKEHLFLKRKNIESIPDTKIYDAYLMLIDNLNIYFSDSLYNNSFAYNYLKEVEKIEESISEQESYSKKFIAKNIFPSLIPEKIVVSIPIIGKAFSETLVTLYRRAITISEAERFLSFVESIPLQEYLQLYNKSVQTENSLLSQFSSLFRQISNGISDLKEENATLIEEIKNLAKSLLERGLITESDYLAIQTSLKKEYINKDVFSKNIKLKTIKQELLLISKGKPKSDRTINNYYYQLILNSKLRDKELYKPAIFTLKIYAYDCDCKKSLLISLPLKITKIIGKSENIEKITIDEKGLNIDFSYLSFSSYVILEATFLGEIVTIEKELLTITNKDAIIKISVAKNLENLTINSLEISMPFDFSVLDSLSKYSIKENVLELKEIEENLTELKIKVSDAAGLKIKERENAILINFVPYFNVPKGTKIIFTIPFSDNISTVKAVNFLANKISVFSEELLLENKEPLLKNVDYKIEIILKDKEDATDIINEEKQLLLDELFLLQEKVSGFEEEINSLVESLNNAKTVETIAVLKQAIESLKDEINRKLDSELSKIKEKEKSYDDIPANLYKKYLELTEKAENLNDKKTIALIESAIAKKDKEQIKKEFLTIESMINEKAEFFVRETEELLSKLKEDIFEFKKTKFSMLREQFKDVDYSLLQIFVGSLPTDPKRAEKELTALENTLKELEKKMNKAKNAVYSENTKKAIVIAKEVRNNIEISYVKLKNLARKIDDTISTLEKKARNIKTKDEKINDAIRREKFAKALMLSFAKQKKEEEQEKDMLVQGFFLLVLLVAIAYLVVKKYRKENEKDNEKILEVPSFID